MATCAVCQMGACNQFVRRTAGCRGQGPHRGGARAHLRQSPPDKVLVKRHREAEGSNLERGLPRVLQPEPHDEGAAGGRSLCHKLAAYAERSVGYCSRGTTRMRRRERAGAGARTPAPRDKRHAAHVPPEPHANLSWPAERAARKEAGASLRRDVGQRLRLGNGATAHARTVHLRTIGV
mgnify:CR=1 FL=1